MKAIFLLSLIWPIATTTNTDSEICDHGSIKPNIYECISFYICIYGKWRKTTCPDKTYFSTHHNFCIPSKSFCYNPSISTTTTTISSTTITNFPISKPNCSTGDLKPYPDSCMKFFMCFKERWILMTCSTGSYFNLTEGFCTIDNNRTCIDNDRKIITTITIPNCPEGHLRPDPNNCANFFICLRNQWRLEKCKINMYFSQKDNYCVQNDGSCIDVRTTKPPKCRPGSLMADKFNCAKYFICLRGDWKILACPKSMYFDIKYEMCLPDYGKCFK